MVKHAIILLVLLLAGCQQAGRVASVQLPGLSTGAGATFAGPTNSAAPSEQTASRTIVYQPPAHEVVVPVVKVEPALVPPKPDAPQAMPQVAWVSETVTTKLGEHQDVSDIVAAAKKVEGWNKFEWMGLLLLVGGFAYILWSTKNPDGYPLVGWKVAGCGLLLLITAGNPWMLALLVLALVFWALQHTGLLKFPGL